MNISDKAKEIYSQIASKSTKLGDLRTIAKEIKKDHTFGYGIMDNQRVLSKAIGDSYYGSKAAINRTY